MNKYINKYHRLHENKLRSLESHNPRDYWKYLKSIDTKNNGHIPDLHDFYEHFKEMSNDFNHDMDD